MDLQNEGTPFGLSQEFALATGSNPQLRVRFLNLLEEPRLQTFILLTSAVNRDLGGHYPGSTPRLQETKGWSIVPRHELAGYT